MVLPLAHKRKTNWRKQIARFGKKVLRNPYKYSAQGNKIPRSGKYLKTLKHRLRNKHRKLYPHEYEN